MGCYDRFDGYPRSPNEDYCEGNLIFKGAKDVPRMKGVKGERFNLADLS